MHGGGGGGGAKMLDEGFGGGGGGGGSGYADGAFSSVTGIRGANSDDGKVVIKYLGQ
jgi:hypothetical protein